MPFSVQGKLRLSQARSVQPALHSATSGRTGTREDDQSKQGKALVSTDIIGLDSVNEYQFDGILISSYTNQKLILDKSQVYGYLNILVLVYESTYRTDNYY